LGQIRDNKRGIWLQKTSGTHGINSNSYFGGNFTTYSNDTTGIPRTTTSDEWHGSFHMNLCPDGALYYQNNGNVSYSPSFEGRYTENYYFDDGTNNTLIAPRIESLSANKRVVFGKNSMYCNFIPGRSEDSYFRPSTGYIDLGQYNTWSDLRGFKSGKIHYYTITTGALPTIGTFLAGDVVINDIAGGNSEISRWICKTSGTFSSATDPTGDTDGSTAVITGMDDTSDFYVGEYVTVSAGLPSATTPYRILEKTDTTITLDTDSDSAQVNVTVATPAPVFVPEGRGEMLLSTTTLALNADADTTLFTVPTGYRCVLTKAVLVAGANANSTDLSIGKDGTETDWLPANQLDNLDAANDAVILMPVPNTTPTLIKSYAAGSVIQAQVSNQAGGATNTLYLYGVLY
jgi:hypothetical protein